MRSTALLAPQTQFLLNRTIGEREEHEIVAGFEAAPCPGRTDKHIARRQCEYIISDLRRSVAFRHRKYSAIRAAIKRAGETFRDQLNGRSDRGHHPASGLRMGV